MKIGIAGVGGIGSNVAVNLVRSGVTCLKLTDCDRVELSNLNRQFYFADQVGKNKVDMLRQNLTRIVPNLQLETSCCQVTIENIRDLFEDCSIIVEGFDRIAEKKMLLEKFSSSDKLIVSANGIAGERLDRVRSKKIGNCFIVGDFSTDCKNAPLYAHKIMAVTAVMTALILEQRATVRI